MNQDTLVHTTTDNKINSLTTFITTAHEVLTSPHCEKQCVKVWALNEKPVTDQKPLSSLKCFNGTSRIDFSNRVFIYDLSAVTVNGGSASNTCSSTSPRIKGELKLNKLICRSVAIDPSDSKLYYCCCSDGAIYIYDIHNQSFVTTFREHKVDQLHIDIASNGHTIWTSESDNTVRVWDLRNNYAVLQKYEFDSRISTVAYCQIGEWLAVGMEPAKVQLINRSSPGRKI